jgi:hypothetical protein
MTCTSPSKLRARSLARGGGGTEGAFRAVLGAHRGLQGGIAGSSGMSGRGHCAALTDRPARD